MTTPKSKKETEREITYARGGSGPTNRMVKPQAATQKPGRTAHDVKGSAPGARVAEGGAKMRGTTAAMPARAGHTSPIKKGR